MEPGEKFRQELSPGLFYFTRFFVIIRHIGFLWGYNMDRFDVLQQELTRRCPSLELRAGEPMSKHTTFRIGGPAALMALPHTEEEAVQAVQIAARCGVSPFFLGNGSNLLVSDRGVERFILKAAGGLERLEPVYDPEKSGLLAGSGVLLSRLSVCAMEQELTGLEFAQGIPGSVGGAVVMNAGAYGGEMAQVVRGVTCLEPDGTVAVMKGEQLRFSYRQSVFSGGQQLILRVKLMLRPGDPIEIREKMETLARKRKAKQPLEYSSAGSAFKRPAPLADGTPVYAAALIDRCGLKGLSVGGAQVSEKHAGFIVNRGGATFDDVLRLIEKVREAVLKRTGVSLEPEVKILT